MIERLRTLSDERLTALIKDPTDTTPDEVFRLAREVALRRKSETQQRDLPHVE